MTWAILGDIHANLEALEAVLADAERQGATAYYCVGDTVGYGPNPIECVERVMPFRLNVLGHFDLAVLTEIDASGLGAAQGILWTQGLLAASDRGARCLDFLASLPTVEEDDGFVFVHGSPRNHLDEFVFPEDIYHQLKMRRIGEQMTGLWFNGNSHYPGIYREELSGEWVYLGPDEFPDGYRIDDRKTLCNVGSVGQPRDGDWRACYVLFDGTLIRHRRVEYDVEATIAKIHAIPELPDFHGDRLREGR